MGEGGNGDMSAKRMAEIITEASTKLREAEALLAKIARENLGPPAADTSTVERTAEALGWALFCHGALEVLTRESMEALGDPRVAEPALDRGLESAKAARLLDTPGAGIRAGQA